MILLLIVPPPGPTDPPPSKNHASEFQYGIIQLSKGSVLSFGPSDISSADKNVYAFEYVQLSKHPPVSPSGPSDPPPTMKGVKVIKHQGAREMENGSTFPLIKTQRSTFTLRKKNFSKQKEKK